MIHFLLSFTQEGILMSCFYFCLFHQQQSTISTAREILKKDGFGNKGLNKGLTSTLGRHGVFNMIYFSFYHNIKNILPEKEVSITFMLFIIQDAENFLVQSRKETLPNQILMVAYLVKNMNQAENFSAPLSTTCMFVTRFVLWI